MSMAIGQNRPRLALVGPRTGRRGRSSAPKLTERLRERVEEEVDKIMDRLLAALEAEQGFVFGPRLDVVLASLPELLDADGAGSAENFDRLEGRSKSDSEFTPGRSIVATRRSSTTRSSGEIQRLTERLAERDG